MCENGTVRFRVRPEADLRRKCGSAARRSEIDGYHCTTGWERALNGDGDLAEAASYVLEGGNDVNRKGEGLSVLLSFINAISGAAWAFGYFGESPESGGSVTFGQYLIQS
jgi:hypothetical protein